MNLRVRIRIQHRCCAKTRDVLTLIIDRHYVPFLPRVKDSLALHKGRNRLQDIFRHLLIITEQQGFVAVVTTILPTQIGGNNRVGERMLEDVVPIRVGNKAKSGDSLCSNPNALRLPFPFTSLNLGQSLIQLFPRVNAVCVLIRTPDRGAGRCVESDESRLSLIRAQPTE